MNLMESMGLLRKKEREQCSIDVTLLKENPDNFYGTDDVTELKQAIIMAGGVRQNLIIEPPDADGTYRIVSGHRRYKAMKELLKEGAEVPKEVPCEIEPDPAIASLLLITTNSSARKLTAWEKIEQYKQLNSLYAYFVKAGKVSGRKREALAAMLGESNTNIARMQVIANNLIDEFTPLLKADKMGISAAYEAAQLPIVDQEILYEQHDNGVTLSDVRQARLSYERRQEDAVTVTGKKEAAEMDGERSTRIEPLPDSVDGDLEQETINPVNSELSAEERWQAVAQWLEELSREVRPKYYRVIEGDDIHINPSSRMSEFDYVGIDLPDGFKICEGDVFQDTRGVIYTVMYNKETSNYKLLAFEGRGSRYWRNWENIKTLHPIGFGFVLPDKIDLP